MKKLYVYYNRDNTEVTRDYCDVICEAMTKIGYSCNYVTSLNGVSKESLILYIVGVDAFKYYLMGYHNFIIWIQGLAGEESFMRNGSTIRKELINYIDVFVLKCAKFILFVSENLQVYYEKKANVQFKNSYIMPCFNERFSPDLFRDKNYSDLRFCYVGSLAKWQCFEQTVEFYKNIEAHFPNASFKVLSFQKDEAIRILVEKGVRNYTVNCVPKEQVLHELKEVSYGFIIRDNVVVNQVATPTKFSSYLAAGVLPIYSACLEDFYKHTADNPYFFSIKENENNEELFAYLLEDKDVDSVKNSVQELFSSYYSPKYHIDQMQKKMGDFL